MGFTTEDVCQLAEWVSSEAIAETLLENLSDQGVEPTFENAQKVWGDVLLTGLNDAVKSSINALVGKGELVEKDE